MKEQYIAVYCGSSLGDYHGPAVKIAEALIQQDFDLVYGAGNVGLMGVVADTFIKHQRKTIGVIPNHLYEKEVAHLGLTELIITETMHERKQIMAEKASGFVALPGGFGTLEELVEVLTWAQLGLHHKPICLYNVDGYYDALIQLFDHMVAQKLLTERNRALLFTSDDALAIASHLKNAKLTYSDKWVDKI